MLDGSCARNADPMALANLNNSDHPPHESSLPTTHMSNNTHINALHSCPINVINPTISTRTDEAIMSSNTIHETDDGALSHMHRSMIHNPMMSKRVRHGVSDINLDNDAALRKHEIRRGFRLHEQVRSYDDVRTPEWSICTVKSTSPYKSLTPIKLPHFREVFRCLTPSAQRKSPEVYPFSTLEENKVDLGVFSRPRPPHVIKSVSFSTHPSQELKCKYRTGKCTNDRAIKSCGDYHNLCNYHRLRANANQRKLDRKKKIQRTEVVPMLYPLETLNASDVRKMMSSPSSASAVSVLLAFPKNTISRSNPLK